MPCFLGKHPSSSMCMGHSIIKNCAQFLHVKWMLCFFGTQINQNFETTSGQVPMDWPPPPPPPTPPPTTTSQSKTQYSPHSIFFSDTESLHFTTVHYNTHTVQYMHIVTKAFMGPPLHSVSCKHVMNFGCSLTDSHVPHRATSRTWTGKCSCSVLIYGLLCCGLHLAAYK